MSALSKAKIIDSLMQDLKLNKQDAKLIVENISLFVLIKKMQEKNVVQHQVVLRLPLI